MAKNRSRRYEDIIGATDEKNAGTSKDCLIGTVVAGVLERLDTAIRVRILLDALSFYADESNYEERQTDIEGRSVFVCPVEEDDCGYLARAALAKAYDRA